MLKSIIKLIEKDRKIIGNHKYETFGNITEYIYHQTCICRINTDTREFSVQNGGWNTVSTKRAINDYLNYFVNIGYKKVNNI